MKSSIDSLIDEYISIVNIFKRYRVVDNNFNNQLFIYTKNEIISRQPVENIETFISPSSVEIKTDLSNIDKTELKNHDEYSEPKVDESYDVSKDYFDTIVFPDFRIKSEDYIEKIIHEVCKIYLEGIYIKESINIKSKISDLINKIDSITTLSENLIGEDEQLQIKDTILLFVNVVRISLSNIKRFSAIIHNKFSLDKSDHLIYIDNNFGLISSINNYPKKIKNLVEFQGIIHSISLIDFNYTSDFAYFEKLIKLENDLKKFKTDETNLYELTSCKLSFLIYKWSKRSKFTLSKKKIKLNINDNVNFNESDNFDDKRLTKWLEKISLHYQFKKGFEKEIAKKIGLKLSIDDFSQIDDLLDIHYLIKYYKDVKKNTSKLKDIMHFFISYENSSKNYDNLTSYDKYCIEVIKNYAINNYFSSYSETANDINNYISEYKYCKDNMSNVVNNYFLHFKFLDNAINLIESNLNTISNDKIDFKQVKFYNEILNNEIKIAIDEYYKTKEWAKTNKNFIFLMPYKFSCICIKGENLLINNLFIASSFVLPYDIESLDIDYSKVRQKYREVKTMSSVLENLKINLLKLDVLNDEFDKKDLKSIEIIGLFTAIITFILSSIPAFKFVNTLNDAMLFTLALSVSLCLFIILILLITRGRKVIKDFLIVIPIIIATFIVGYILLKNNEEKSINNLINNSVENKLKIESSDSLRKVIIEDFIKEYESKNKTNKEVKK